MKEWTIKFFHTKRHEKRQVGAHRSGEGRAANPQDHIDLASVVEAGFLQARTKILYFMDEFLNSINPTNPINSNDFLCVTEVKEPALGWAAYLSTGDHCLCRRLMGHLNIMFGINRTS